MKKSKIPFLIVLFFAFNIANADSSSSGLVQQHENETLSAEQWYKDTQDYWLDKDGKKYIPVPWDKNTGDYGQVREAIINSRNTDKDQMRQETENLRFELESNNSAEFQSIRESFENGTTNALGGDKELSEAATEAYNNNLNRNREKKNKDGSSKTDYQNRILSGAIFTGDERLACEAKMCLRSSVKPSECHPSLKRYHSIKRSTSSKTRRARKAFLDICKEVGSSAFLL